MNLISDLLYCMYFEGKYLQYTIETNKCSNKYEYTKPNCRAKRLKANFDTI